MKNKNNYVRNYIETPSESLSDYTREMDAASTNPFADALSSFGAMAMNQGIGMMANGVGEAKAPKEELAYGGTIGNQPGYELEGKEVLETPQGQVGQVKGPSHENGGVDMDLPDGTKVYSKRISRSGETLANRKKGREQKLIRLEKKLKKDPFNSVLKRTVKHQKKNNEKLDKEDLEYQEFIAQKEHAKQQATMQASAMAGAQGGQEGQEAMLQAMMQGAQGGMQEGQEEAVQAGQEKLANGSSGTNEKISGTSKEYQALTDRVNKQSSANFIQRLKDENRSSINVGKNGEDIANFKMASYGEDDHEVVFPMIQSKNGKLEDHTDRNAFPYSSREEMFQNAIQSAVNNGDTIHAPMGVGRGWAENNYKKYYPGFENKESQALNKSNKKQKLEEGSSGTVDPLKPWQKNLKKLGSSMGNATGLAGDLYSSFAPMLHTKEVRKGDTANVNPYEGYGQRGLDMNQQAMNYANIQRDAGLNTLANQRRSASQSNRNSARGVNTQRGLDLATLNATNTAGNALYQNAATNTMTQMNARGALYDAQDKVLMSGEQSRDLAERNARDNYNSQLAKDITTAGTGLQALGKDANAIRFNKESGNVMEQLSNYGIVWDPITGTFLVPEEVKARLKKEAAEAKAAEAANN